MEENYYILYPLYKPRKSHLAIYSFLSVHTEINKTLLSPHVTCIKAKQLNKFNIIYICFEVCMTIWITGYMLKEFFADRKQQLVIIDNKLFSAPSTVISCVQQA